ncbi:MAG TPA: ribonuclease III [Lacipirellulaceae bacterium]|nr:ribonuclease III [Lacipirellulaceae bacterium]
MSTDLPIEASDLRRWDFAACQARLGYQFRDARMLEAALTHASGVQHRLSSNERMEFLGDAILGMVVCERLFQQYPEYSEGELTKIKSVVVSRDTCARLSDALGLSEHLILGKGMAADPTVPRSVLAAAFESLVAAIYLDGGMGAAERFILDHVDAEIEAAVRCEFGGNFKSLLQQHAQREFGVTPNYMLLDEKGPDHSKCFKVAAQISGRRFSAAWGKSKKESEQRAAHNAISQLRGQPEPYPCEESNPVEIPTMAAPAPEGEPAPVE